MEEVVHKEVGGDDVVEPRDIGLVYESWRRGQREVIERVIEEWDRWDAIGVQAPTGYGKSGIAVAVQALKGGVIAVRTNKMQEQIKRDAPSVPISKGRRHYLCALPEFSGVSAEDAPCAHGLYEWGETCPARKSCAYFASRDKIVLRGGVVPWSMVLTDQRLMRMPIILDEAHHLDEILTQHLTVRLSQKELAQLGLRVMPSCIHASEIHVYASCLMEQALSHFGLEDSVEYRKRLLRIYGQARRLTLIARMRPIVWRRGHVLHIAPTDLSHQRFLHKVIGLSGTLMGWHDMAQELGLRRSMCIDLPHIFPSTNRPVYIMPVAPMGTKVEAYSVGRIAKAMDKLLDRHPRDKGVVHTCSYRIAELLYKLSNRKERLIVQRDRNKDIERFEESSEPYVILSPSLYEGWDGHMAGFQICAKMPWPDLGDPIIAHKPGEWYRRKALCAFVQMCGRIVRRPEQKKPTYVLDSDALWFLRQSWKYLPLWFRESVHYALPGKDS